MKFFSRIFLAIAAAVALLAVPASAQGTGGLYWQCVSGANPSWCPVNRDYPLPTETAALNYVNLSANGTTVIKSGAGSLESVIVNTAGGSNSLTLYDNTAGSGTVIAVIDSTSRGTLIYNLDFAVGLTAVLSGGSAANVTISWR